MRHNGIEIDAAARTITHRGGAHVFDRPGKRYRDFEMISYFILAGGASLEMAFWQFYGDDADGGPISGPNVFLPKLCRWQERVLNALFLEYRSYVIGGVSFYEIVSKDQKTPPQRFAYARRGRLNSLGGTAIIAGWTRPQKEQSA